MAYKKNIHIENSVVEIPCLRYVDHVDCNGQRFIVRDNIQGEELGLRPERRLQEYCGSLETSCSLLNM